MAVNVRIHVARIDAVSLDLSGNYLDKSSSNTTIKQVLQSQLDHRVIQDTTLPNTTNYPDIPTYLKLEAAQGYVLSHLSQNLVVTYQQGDLNNATSS